MKHLAVIMDGNNRWSVKNNKTQKEGYIAGLDKLIEITNFCIQKKIPYISAFAMSSENFLRPSINFIYEIIKEQHINFLDKLKNNKEIKLNFIGELDKLPKNIYKILDEIKYFTKNNKHINLNIVLNYGSEYEILNIINKILKSKKNELVTLNDLKENLYLRYIPEPDLLIRTGGYQRLSNFLLIYLKYTELYFTKTLWPDLNINEINKIINDYTNIKKNYGL